MVAPAIDCICIPIAPMLLAAPPIELTLMVCFFKAATNPEVPVALKPTAPGLIDVYLTNLAIRCLSFFVSFLFFLQEVDE